MTPYKNYRTQALVLALVAIALTGCLGEPDVEDGWTRIDMHSENITPREPLAPGTACSVSVNAAITYRSIVTGFAVTELRASGTVSPNSVAIAKDAPRLQMAQDIDYLLQNSVSIGRATRAVTGWDHLIQTITFNFNAFIPATLDTSVAPAGSRVNVFLVSYLGEGDEIELADGSDSLVVTPFDSNQYEILPIGMELSISSGGGP